MGYGPVVNGKHTPITPYKGSWAYEQEQKRQSTQGKPNANIHRIRVSDDRHSQPVWTGQAGV